jgi:anthranilate synthase component 2
MILVVDNYDSFTWNLVQALGALGAEPSVRRNDEISAEEAEAGVSVELVRRLSGRIPILGVCLGHQAIGAAFGGRVVRAPRVMHGKVSEIEHSGAGIFEGLSSRFPATRYHSLVVAEEGLPPALSVIAWSAEPGGPRVIQGLKHREHETWGVQFHPESIETEVGPVILANFLRRVGGLR